MSPTPVTLRGHHLLCMLTYQSEGYTADFVARFDAVVEALNQGAPITLCDGPDTLCETVLETPDCHCHNASVVQRDRLALEAVGAVLQADLGKLGTLVLNEDTVRRLRTAFADGRLREACGGCEWQRLCSRIARRHYQGVRLYPGARGGNT